MKIFLTYFQKICKCYSAVLIFIIIVISWKLQMKDHQQNVYSNYVVELNEENEDHEFLHFDFDMNRRVTYPWAKHQVTFVSPSDRKN